MPWLHELRGLRGVSRVNRLNPLNFLVGKIFLMFWSMIALTTLSIAIIASQVELDLENKPIPHFVINKIESLEDDLRRMRHRSPHNLERLLHSPRLARKNLLIFAKQGENPRSTKRLPAQFDMSRLPFDSEQPTTFIESELIVYGPFSLKYKESQYRLFFLSPYAPRFMMRYQHLPLWLRLGLPLLISAILSFVMAKSLVKPIHKLRNANRLLAQGKLDTRSNGVALRNDELGELGKDFDNMAIKMGLLLAAQKRLLGDVSHELRSPLARLQVALGLAVQGDVKDLPRHLQRIELEAQRLDDMVGDVLRLSRLESALQSLELFPLSLKSLLAYLVKDANFEAMGDCKNVTLEAEHDAKVMGDQALLASAFENVMRNAVKYTDEKTSVLVSLRHAGDQVKITIRDFGPGVPTCALAQLFQPFYRVSDSRQRSSGGSGLGLAIAEKSIRSHGGSISARNHQDHGLEITIKLPLYQGNDFA